MTESAYSSIRGAEISERSSELVLPSSALSAAQTDAPKSEEPSDRLAAAGWRTASISEPASAFTSPRPDRDSSTAGSLASTPTAPNALPATAISDPTIAMGGETVSQLPTESPITASPSESPASLGGEPEVEISGRALPGDRGPRDPGSGSQRPSFWRRIALGRRAQALRAAQLERASLAPAPADASARLGTRGDPTPIDSRSGERASALAPAGQTRVASDARALDARASEAVERRIVEPLLQALVSVEAKLERSHVDLVGRSDQVEQRLTQLWDIEEQLGALGDLQESVLQVTEQQRRLEAALVAQTRILRWLIGGIILSLAVASFCVAFFLRVAR
jgi:hypothetical protein